MWALVIAVLDERHRRVGRSLCVVACSPTGRERRGPSISRFITHRPSRRATRVPRGSLRSGVDADRRDVAPPDHSRRVDDEERAVALPFLRVVHTVRLRDGALRLEVGEQWEVQLAVARERAVTPHAIHRDPDQLGPVLAELRQDLVVKAHLITADRTPIRGVEREDHGATAELGQRNALVRGALEFEVRRLHAWAQRSPVLVRRALSLLVIHPRTPVDGDATQS